MQTLAENEPVQYSVVVPFYNEEGCVIDVLCELVGAMRAIGAPFEVIAIDDGSTDSTPARLRSAADEAPEIRVLTAPENRGQSAAFLAGCRAARGASIITMDGDGQNDPADIARLIEVFADADLVCGWRVDRRDTRIRRWISRSANTIRRRALRDGIHDTGCSLKIFRGEVADAFVPFHGVHRFLPAMAAQLGFRVAETPVNHRSRETGRTKYSFRNRGLGTLADLRGVRWLARRRLRLAGYTEPGAGGSGR